MAVIEGRLAAREVPGAEVDERLPTLPPPAVGIADDLGHPHADVRIVAGGARHLQPYFGMKSLRADFHCDVSKFRGR